MIALKKRHDDYFIYLLINIKIVLEMMKIIFFIDILFSILFTLFCFLRFLFQSLTWTSEGYR